MICGQLVSIPTLYHDCVLLGKHHSDFDFDHNGDMDTLAERLRKEREAQGLTQKELATKAGLPGQSHIGNLESGARKSSTRLPEIAAALGVSALWLATGKGPKRLSEYSDKALEVAALYMAADDDAKSAMEFIIKRAKMMKDFGPEVIDAPNKKVAGED